MQGEASRQEAPARDVPRALRAEVTGALLATVQANHDHAKARGYSVKEQVRAQRCRRPLGCGLAFVYEADY